MDTQTLTNTNITDYGIKSNLSKNIFHPRLAWMIYYQQVHSIKKVCEKFRISRKTFYKWWWRYYKSGYQTESLFDKSRKPNHSPLATPYETIKKILEAKELTGYGPRRLKEYLLKNHGIKISERTIWKILKKYGIQNNNKINEEKTHNNSFLPGDEVYLYAYKAPNILQTQSLLVLNAIDIATRLRIAKLYSGLNATALMHYLQILIKTFPFKIKKLKIVDKSLHEMFDKSLNLFSEIQFSSVNKYEKDFIQKEIYDYDLENFFNSRRFNSLSELNEEFKNFINQYNNHLPNHALNGFTPLKKLRDMPLYQNIIYFDYPDSLLSLTD